MNQNKESGLTVIEMLIAITLTAILSGIVIQFAFGYWHFAYRAESDQNAMVERLNASDYLREMIGTSSGLINQNSIPDANSNVDDPGQPSGEYWLILHAVPGLKSLSGTDDLPILYFKRFSFNTSNEIIMNGVNPFEDEFVIYLSGATKQLRVRALANPSATGNRILTSCPPEIATSACPADKVLVNDMTGVELRYFSRAGFTIDWTSSTDPISGEYNGPDFAVAEVAELKLQLARKPLFESANTTQSTTTIRIALRNS